MIECVFGIKVNRKITFNNNNEHNENGEYKMKRILYVLS